MSGLQRESGRSEGDGVRRFIAFGLPTSRPLIFPEPESRDMLTPSSLTSTLVILGPMVSTPRFTASSRKNGQRGQPKR